METLNTLLAHPAYLYPTLLVLGLCIGSFLNVVILRLPKMLDQEWRCQCEELLEVPEAQRAAQQSIGLATPRSRCPQCGHQITALENIPVISYLLLGGKCSSCKTKISVRYPMIEMATGLLTVLTVLLLGPTVGALWALLLVWALIALAMIDFDTQLLPDKITLPLLWLGLVLNYSSQITDFESAFWGAVAGYMVLWLVYHAFRLTTGKEGMGYGDFKLLGALGAWLGWQMLPAVILLSSLVGAIIGISLILFGGRGREVPIPFGPYLAAAGILALWWGPQINHAWLSYLGG
ncbi:prepilin peptidase [Mangrovitalea sediminis]|uniref:prepilin peptidase n=1 Tax=Mangrovitalea sediminis TaxID=1982043 RepID=UPI000BE4F13C|nr:A24 family peptidase [Mangrovitalea sediminis]